jgi:rhodanese-related sulfurtransferase
LAQKLGQQGYRESYALLGGYDAWKKAGLAVERKAQAA